MTVLRANSNGRTSEPLLPATVAAALKRRCLQFLGLGLVGASAIIGAAILTYAPGDPSLNLSLIHI